MLSSIYKLLFGILFCSSVHALTEEFLKKEKELDPPTYQLFSAIIKKNLGRLYSSIHNQANLNYQLKHDKYGWTPAHVAAFGDCLKCLVMLHNAEADMELYDRGGWRPVHVAAYNGAMHSMYFFLTSGFKIWKKTKRLGTTKKYAHYKKRITPFEISIERLHHELAMLIFWVKPKNRYQKRFDLLNSGFLESLQDNESIDNNLTQKIYNPYSLLQNE